MCQASGPDGGTQTGPRASPVHISFWGLEGTWGALEHRPARSWAGAGLPWSIPVPQVTAPQFTALSGQCQAWALMCWLTFCPLGRKAQHLALGSFREQQLPCLLGLGTRLPSVAVGEAKPGGPQESPLPPIPTWGQGPHRFEPVFSLRNGIGDLSFTGPVRIKWHSTAWCLPGGGGLLGRGMEEAWGIKRAQSSRIISLGRKRNVLASARPPISCVTL